MTTGKDYGLPAEYADWVEFHPAGNRFPSHAKETVEVTTTKHLDLGSGWWSQTPVTRHFAPPKPKPTPPDVGPGGVLRYVSKVGSTRRAIRGNYGWRVFERGTPVVFCGTDFKDPIATDAELLADVNDDGFTIELEGL